MAIPVSYGWLHILARMLFCFKDKSVETAEGPKEGHGRFLLWVEHERMKYF